MVIRVEILIKNKLIYKKKENHKMKKTNVHKIYPPKVTMEEILRMKKVQIVIIIKYKQSNLYHSQKI